MDSKTGRPADQFTPNQPYQYDITDDVQAWITAGVAERNEHNATATQTVVSQGAFVVSDGAVDLRYAHADLGEEATTATQTVCDQLIGRMATLPTLDSQAEANTYAQQFMDRTSKRVAVAGGTYATALAAGLTLNEAGDPHMFFMNRGNSRALGHPIDTSAHGGRTLATMYNIQQADHMNPLLEARLKKRQQDGTADFELFTDYTFTHPSGELVSSWLGQNSEGQGADARLVPLKPGVRHRFILATAGVFLDPALNTHSRSVVQQLMRGKRDADNPSVLRTAPPQQVAEHLSTHAIAGGDNQVVVFDIGVVKK